MVRCTLVDWLKFLWPHYGTLRFPTQLRNCARSGWLRNLLMACSLWVSEQYWTNCLLGTVLYIFMKCIVVCGFYHTLIKHISCLTMYIFSTIVMWFIELSKFMSDWNSIGPPATQQFIDNTTKIAKCEDWTFLIWANKIKMCKISIDFKWFHSRINH